MFVSFSQFVTEGSDQCIVKPVVEYCVVCGDKASGRSLQFLHSTWFFPISMWAAKPMSCTARFPQGVTMGRSAARAAKDSSNAASGRTWYTHAGGPESAPSISCTGTAVSTAGCSAASPWAWSRTVSWLSCPKHTLGRGCPSGILTSCALFLCLAVQCERKPVEVTREKSLNCAASTEKIYIRKNLCSPLAATPTFVSDKETARSVIRTHQSGEDSQHFFPQLFLFCSFISGWYWSRQWWKPNY